MDRPLYLDTARLGRMSPAACLAQKDFATLASEAGGSIHLERVLAHGLASAAPQWQVRYPGLSEWGGIACLKRSLRELAGSRPDLPVLLANRSAELMKLASRLLFHRCRNVLVTDLGWPSYHDLLHSEARRTNRLVTTTAVREGILSGRTNETELVERLTHEFRQARCDGLFLTAVSNLGVHLPVEQIVGAVEAASDLWFVVIDGAQDFCHIGSDLRQGYCDLYLAGCHKWLAAYQPMGLGFYGRRRSRQHIDTVLRDMLDSRDLDDPLLRFSRELESDGPGGLGETVNLAPLFACQGAVSDALRRDNTPSLELRLRNLETVAEASQGTGWSPLLPAPELRSGILLLQAERPKVREASAASLRSTFADAGVVLTAYERGVVRLSMPAEALPSESLGRLRHALQLAA